LAFSFLAEAFHHQLRHTNRYEEVSKRIRLGCSVDGRDEKGIKKTVSAFLKILHPIEPPTDEEFEEYVAYAIECRRRIKEQMNKRKPDDEFARINLSCLRLDGSEVVVYCPETRHASATLEPLRRRLGSEDTEEEEGAPAEQTTAPSSEAVDTAESTPAGAAPAPQSPQEKHFTILYRDTGHTYESIVGPYLFGAKAVVIEDPCIRAPHQVTNVVRFCEAVSKQPTVRKITLVTSYDDQTNLAELSDKLEELKRSDSTTAGSSSSAAAWTSTRSPTAVLPSGRTISVCGGVWRPRSISLETRQVSRWVLCRESPPSPRI